MGEYMFKSKKIMWMAGVALLIILCIYSYYPRRIHNEYNGLMYRIGDRNYTENIKIMINGYFSKGFLKGDRFQGTITIGEKLLSKIDMRFDDINRGHLFSYEEGDYADYGTMFISKRMEKLTIGVYKDHNDKGGKTWSTREGLMISAPALNREEAVQLSNILMKNMLLNEAQIH